ncbi:MAG: FAD-dependent oxidoreductase [Methylobacteriaceae bacterium]|jgi:NADPH-dependent 2,4-dienoyl-CoA reductase/sulfur reductase-like enzyme|nr:FAD-dependent oxidoreductase [Methylobacteriaceae bacterium]
MTAAVAIIGAGPAGVRAAEVLVRAGVRPRVFDEGLAAGGRIYQRPPGAFKRSAKELYGLEAAKAERVHNIFAKLEKYLDYRPQTLVWDIAGKTLFTLTGGTAYGTETFEQIIIAPGAVDRVMPLPGWTLPGVTTLGGAQIALKTQGVAIGEKVALVGSGPLLWLLAHQYVQAGAPLAALVDTTSFAAKARASAAMMAGDAATTLKGVYYTATLRLKRIPIHEGAVPVAIRGEERPRELLIKDGKGRDVTIACDAVALGWGLKPETRLADIAGVPFDYDEVQQNWIPVREMSGKTAVQGVYLAGDGARIGGADMAELAGARAAWAVLGERGAFVDEDEVNRLERALKKEAAYRDVLDKLFPFPSEILAGLPEETVLCRCEGVSIAGLKRTCAADAVAMTPLEVNRAKAFTRVGMGRCQGRMCGHTASEILARELKCGVREAGRLRAQPPVKPVPLVPVTTEALT